MNTIPVGPFDVFLSYSSQDVGTAELIVEAFERQGWKVWWDRRIAAGEYYDVAIEKALDASRTVVLLWSSASAASNWVRGEAEEAASRNALVPARLDGTQLPLRLRRIQAVDLTGWQPTRAHGGFQALLLAVAGMLGKPVIEAGPLPSAAEYSAEGERHEREGDLRKAAESYIRALRADANDVAAYAGLLRLATANSRARGTVRESNLELGVVRWFDPVKGFGFVMPEAEGLPIFIHVSAVERAGLQTLLPGQRVAFTVVSNGARSSISRMRLI